MNRKSIKFLLAALTATSSLIPFQPVHSDPGKLNAFCSQARVSIKSEKLPKIEETQALKAIGNYCSLAQLMAVIPSNPTVEQASKLCNDITYEVKNRWGISEKAKAALLNLIGSDCLDLLSRK